MASILTKTQHDKTSVDRLREFSDAFIEAYALGPQSNWFEAIAHNELSDAPEVVFMVPVHAAGYEEFLGELRYRSLAQRRARVIPRLWQDGVKELEGRVAQASWLGWNLQAQLMADQAMRLPAKTILQLLTANGGAGGYVGLYDTDTTPNATYTLFHAAHLNNVVDASKGTFDNTALAGSGGFTSTNVGAWFSHFAGLKAPDGESSLGLRLTHVLVPRQLEVAARNFFASDYLIRAIIDSGNVAAAGQEQNLYKGLVEVLVSDELTSGTVVYPLALNKPGMMPFVTVQAPSPEIIVQDKTSHLYQTSLHVGVAALHKVNSGIVFPQTIAKATFS